MNILLMTIGSAQMVNTRKIGEVGMKELIIKVDDPGERAWDGSPKTFEIQELVRCKDCKHGEPGACGDGVDCDGVWHGDDWFCADGERKSD